MRKQRNVFYSNKPTRKYYVDFSPKIYAKNQETSFIKNKSKQHVSAHHYRRPQPIPYPSQIPQISQNIQKKQILINKQQHGHILNKDQIQNSVLYRLLEQQIEQLTKNKKSQKIKLQQKMDTKKKQLENTKKQEYSVKLQIWQLRNEIFDLQESVEQESRQQQRLKEQLGNRRQQLQGQNNRGHIREQSSS